MSADDKILEPSLASACTEDKLSSKFTPSLAKLRYHYEKIYGKSDSESSFVYSLENKKGLFKKEVWENKDGTKSATLVFEKFIE